MQSITLFACPLLFEDKLITGIVYETTQVNGSHPKVHEISDEKGQQPRRSESLGAIPSSTVSRRRRSEFEPVLRRNASSKSRRHVSHAGVSLRERVAGPLAIVQQKEQMFKVATALTLGTISRAPWDFEADERADEHAAKIVKDTLSSQPNLAPTNGDKKQGAHYRTEEAVQKHFQRRVHVELRISDETATTDACKHKFRQGRCRKCGTPEADPEASGLRSGFHCIGGRCPGCASCSSLAIPVPKEEVEEESCTARAITVPKEEKEEEELFTTTKAITVLKEEVKEVSCVTKQAPGIEMPVLPQYPCAASTDLQQPLRPISKVTPPPGIDIAFVNTVDDLYKHDDAIVSHVSDEARYNAPLRPVLSLIDNLRDSFVTADDTSCISPISTTFSDDLFFSSSPTRCPSQCSSICTFDTPTPCPAPFDAERAAFFSNSASFRDDLVVDELRVSRDNVPATALSTLQTSATTLQTWRDRSHNSEPNISSKDMVSLRADTAHSSKETIFRRGSENRAGQEPHLLSQLPAGPISNEALPVTNPHPVLNASEDGTQANGRDRHTPAQIHSSVATTPQPEPTSNNPLHPIPPLTVDKVQIPRATSGLPVLNHSQEIDVGTAQRLDSSFQLFLSPATPEAIPATTSTLPLDTAPPLPVKHVTHAVSISQLSVITHAVSISQFSVIVPAVPLDILEVIAQSAVYGDTECQVMISKLHREISNRSTLAVEPRWDKRERHLIRVAKLVLDLESEMRSGHTSLGIVETVRTQLFPKTIDEKLADHVFNSYIHHAIRCGDLSETRAAQILLLATGDGSCEESQAERAVFDGRDLLGPDGFVYSNEEQVVNRTGDVSLYGDLVTPEELTAAAQTLPELDHRVRSYISDVEHYIEGDRRSGAFTPCSPPVVPRISLDGEAPRYRSPPVAPKMQRRNATLPDIRKDSMDLMPSTGSRASRVFKAGKQSNEATDTDSPSHMLRHRFGRRLRNVGGQRADDKDAIEEKSEVNADSLSAHGPAVSTRTHKRSVSHFLKQVVSKVRRNLKGSGAG